MVVYRLGNFSFLLVESNCAKAFDLFMCCVVAISKHMKLWSEATSYLCFRVPPPFPLSERERYQLQYWHNFINNIILIATNANIKPKLILVEEHTSIKLGSQNNLVCNTIKTPSFQAQSLKCQNCTPHPINKKSITLKRWYSLSSMLFPLWV